MWLLAALAAANAVAGPLPLLLPLAPAEEPETIEVVEMVRAGGGGGGLRGLPCTALLGTWWPVALPWECPSAELDRASAPVGGGGVLQPEGVGPR